MLIRMKVPYLREMMAKRALKNSPPITPQFHSILYVTGTKGHYVVCSTKDLVHIIAFWTFRVWLCRHCIDILSLYEKSSTCHRFEDGTYGFCSNDNYDGILKCGVAHSSQEKQERDERIWFTAYCVNCPSDESKLEDGHIFAFRDYEFQLLSLRLSTTGNLVMTGGDDYSQSQIQNYNSKEEL